MSSELNPRLVLKEFGLLNAGLFNKIRFPGRFETDESGNRVNSEYNAARIDFTGDLAELYVEPDTFYLQDNNELMMRKRKRNEDGEVIEIKRLKVGKLDITEVLRVRDDFTTNRERDLKELDKVQRALIDFEFNTYRKGEVNSLVSNVGTISQQGIDSQRQYNAAINRAITAISSLTMGEGDQIRRILGEQFVSIAAYEDKLLELARKDALDKVKRDYLSREEYNQEKTGTLVLRTYLQDTHPTKEELDAFKLRVQDLLKGEPGDGVDEIDTRLQTNINVQNLKENMQRIIPKDLGSLVDEARLAVIRAALYADVNTMRQNIAGQGSTITGFRNDLQGTTNLFNEYRAEIGQKINNAFDANTGSAALLEEAFTRFNSELTGRVDSNTGDLGQIKPFLGLGTDVQDRTFAYLNELTPVKDRVGEIDDAVIPEIAVQLDTINANLTQLNGTVVKDKVFADENFVSRNNQADLDDLAELIQQDVQGYTTGQVRAILKSFYDVNFYPTMVYPSKRLWYEVNIQTSVGLPLSLTRSDRVARAGKDGTTDLVNKVQLGSNSNQIKAPGVDLDMAPGNLLLQINGQSSLNREFFSIYQNRKNLWIVYPRRVLTNYYGNKDKRFENGPDMRFSLTFVDHTPTSSTSDFPQPRPVMYWVQKVQDYDGPDGQPPTRMRIDRVVPTRPWASGDAKYPGDNVNVDIIIESALDTVPYVFPDEAT